MKKIVSIEEAIKSVKDGMVLMIGGFLTSGGPNKIMDALAETNIKNLTLICNDSGYADKGLGKLIANGQTKKVIASYIGANAVCIDKMNSGELEVEFSPQGSLAERVRAGGAGLGGILTPTGLGTVVQDGKQIINVDGRDFILEKPLKADIAFIGASIADKSGNLYFKGTTRNFNSIMAMAADLVVVEPDEIVETGAIKPEDVHTPAILVDYIIKTN